MKRLIITTTVLLIATVLITVVYFKNLNTPGQHTSEIMRNIPADAALLFEINNDQSFYDIFADNKLFNQVIGQEKMDELDTLRKTLILDPALKTFLNDQNIFISLHPLAVNGPGLLLTLSVAKDFKSVYLEQFIDRNKERLNIKPTRIDGKAGYDIEFKNINKHFYLVNKGDGIFCGSFSREIADKAAGYLSKNSEQHFVLMPDRQNANSLANLYADYSQLTPLFQQFFTVRNEDIFKPFRLLPATAALTLNYKTDALMFSGISTVQTGKPISYLNLFTGQLPVENHLKEIFPSTTAYSTAFAVTDPSKFLADLGVYHVKAGLESEKKALFDKITAETGLKLKNEFSRLLGNEFAVVTTRYQEKIGIIAIKNGAQMAPIMNNISAMADENIGQFKYSKLPFFLIGDTFSIFNKPYFRILDNYLILANTEAEITSYYDSYSHRKFLNKGSDYNRFDELLAEKSNVSFFINFKNSQHILKQELTNATYAQFENNNPGWKNLYGASCQLSSANKNYYTNLCIQLNRPDTASAAKMNQ